MERIVRVRIMESFVYALTFMLTNLMFICQINMRVHIYIYNVYYIISLY